MPTYMIDTIIGLGFGVKEKLVKQISLKLKENGYPARNLAKTEYNDLGLVYWTFETDGPVPDKLLEKIKQEAGKLNDKNKVSIKPM